MIDGCQPRLLTLSIFKSFRGVPSGLLVSQRISPSKPEILAINFDKSLIVMSNPVPTFKKVRGNPLSSKGAFESFGDQYSNSIKLLMPNHQHA